MHDCPFCQMACDCDGEDTYLNAPDDCRCECCHDCGGIPCVCDEEDFATLWQGIATSHNP